MFSRFIFSVLILPSVALLAEPLEEAGEFFDRGNFSEGDRVLTAWMTADPAPPRLREGFLLLETSGQLTKRVWPKRLASWAGEPGTRGELSRFYAATGLWEAGDGEAAAVAFSEMTESNLGLAARVRLVAVWFDLERAQEAAEQISAIGELTDEAEILAYLRGLEVEFWLRQKKPERAVTVFDSLAISDFTNVDLFHAALAGLWAEGPEKMERFRQVLAEKGEVDLLAELDFEEGIYLANRSDARAFDKLPAFLREHGDHPRAADAEIALAEKHLNQALPQPQAARDRQASAMKRPLLADQTERLDYSKIWTEKIAGDLNAVVTQATRFLASWPNSDRRPEVMLMLGRAHFELGHYPSAISQFEQLSALHGESELVELALFFAAKAASLTMTFENQEKALTMWETVAERGGQLAEKARHEQGLLHLANHRLDEAMVAFSLVLAEGKDEISPEFQIALFCDLGHALFLKALGNQNDAELLAEAIRSFELAENHPKATTAWRYQAKVRRGKCLEALGQFEAASAIFAEVIREGETVATSKSASIPLDEFDWFYRAGFSAIELLETQSDWKAAVQLAERLAETTGHRAIEARERANRLRLKHFVWETEK